ncbi:MAG TPA: long-chain fatty acid--CoA ligase [Nevskiaceae bacterium]|nr:long-chain fatty acid--CoA ligase [Nevskiaceae bacterium]
MSTIHLTQPLHRGLRMCPARIATVCAGRRRTYAEFGDRVARAAAALKALGVRPGDRVGILSLNSDRYLELYFATWWAGAVVNPVNLRWHPREIAGSLDDCETRLLVVDDTFAPMVEELSGRSRELRTVLHAGDGPAPAGMFGYEELIREHRPVADERRGGDALAGVFYTGGTTGAPKGVMLSHANLWSSAMQGLVEDIVGDAEVGLHAAPMFHLADGMFALMLALRQATHVVVPAFQPETVLAALESEGITATLLVPTMIQMLVDHPRLPEFRLDRLRTILYGASPISEALLQRTMQRLPGAGLVQAYGQTEMAPLVSILDRVHHRDPRHRAKLRSAGRPALGTEVRILDAEGRDVPRGTVGEIVARGPGMMHGYWNSPQQTAAALRDGWLHTGDGAYLDDDGYLFIVDRVKDMIVSGGENVFSAEVENALAQHPGVASCAVIGIPDAHWGEAVHAVVVRKPGTDDVDEDELRAHCRRLIAPYKCPRSVEFRESLPMSGAGKILKTTLREPYWQNQARRVG